MRRLPLAAVAAASLIALAACGDSNSSSDTTAATATTSPPESTTATTAGPTTTVPVTVPAPTYAKPTVSVPATAPTELKITDLVVGTGEGAADLDQVIVNYVGVRTRDGVEFDSSYGEGKKPFTVDLGAGTVIKGWDQGLQGVKAGGRRQLDIPSALAYGANAQGDKIGPNENLTFIIDVLAVVKPTKLSDQPTLVLPPATPVTEVQKVDLVEGTGATANQGMTATFDYIFYRADTGAQLFTSWGDAQAVATVPLNPNGAIDGIVEGMYGMKVGGRRQITIPFAKVFDGAGNQNMGLPASVDLVVVVDLRAAY